MTGVVTYNTHLAGARHLKVSQCYPLLARKTVAGADRVGGDLTKLNFYIWIE